MAQQSEKRGGWGFRAGLLIGVALGAAAGLLLAPRPGKETRDGLLDQAELVRSKGLLAGLEEQAAELRRNLNEVREVLREALAEGREVLREALEEGKRASAETQAELRREYHETVGQPPSEKP